MNAGKRMLRPELFLVRQRLQGMQRYLWLCVMFSLVLISDGSPSKPCEKSCLSGRCVNGSCVCDRGWVGDQCQHCQGRFKWVFTKTFKSMRHLNLFSAQEEHGSMLVSNRCDFFNCWFIKHLNVCYCILYCMLIIWSIGYSYLSKNFW